MEQQILLCEFALSYLDSMVDQAQVSIGAFSLNSVAVKDQALEQMNTCKSQEFTVTVYINKSKGIASTSIINHSSIKKICDKIII